jgi:lysylphosphatidylglycerol synthetase-like protein (DUF2156 family)
MLRLDQVAKLILRTEENTLSDWHAEGMTTNQRTPAPTKPRIIPIATLVAACIVGVLMMLFGLGGGFDPAHNVLHFASGAAIVAFLLKFRTHVAHYMLGFGLFYFVIGGVGTVHHETIDATFLNTPFHPGHIFIGMMFLTVGAAYRATSHR